MLSKRFAITLTISGLALGVGACGASSDDKAGGAVRTAPVTLRLADATGAEAIAEMYADEVARRSHGSLRIDVKLAWRYRQPQRQARTFADVRAGKVELGVDATRGFDEVGVTSFDALHAPLLIDSLALEEKVLRGPLPSEMLKGLGSAGVVGIGVLPGPLRRPLGLTRPFRSPSDYRGQAFGIVRSPVAAATLGALGATAHDFLGPPLAAYKLDGLESDLATIVNQAYDDGANAVTANVVLWPRPEVLYANRAALARLTPQQRRVLTEAARATISPALASLRVGEAQAARVLCSRGLRFTTGDLAALEHAVAPAYAGLDARTRADVETIRALGKDAAADPPFVCAGPAPSPTLGAKTPLDGTYRMHISHAQGLRDAHGAEPVEENYGDFRYVLDRGKFFSTQKNGRSDRYTRGIYVVDGDRLTITVKKSGGVIPNGADEKPGDVFDYKWSLYRHRLSLRPWRPEPGIFNAVWTSER